MIKLLFTISVLAISLTYCSSTETTVVDREPTAGTSETADTAKAEVSEDNFKDLSVGTVYPIHSLDPLFAQNPAEFRTVQALYETLVTYNDEGELVPSLATDWQISEDSLEYTFSLRSKIFYHDSQIFANGIGRRVVSTDVVNAFHRMAKPEIPQTAARMFSTIKGFEPYHKEQHKVYLQKLRKINGIEGIVAVDEATVRFTLKQKDPLFLNKLAAPYASIYPLEATRNTETPLHTNPVGTGPYKFAEMPGDSSLVLERFDNYVYKSAKKDSEFSTPPLDRIDINYFENKRQLLRYFSNNDVDLIHELSPELKSMMLDSNGNAKDLDFDYRLHKTNARSVVSIKLNTNSDAELNADQAVYLDEFTGPDFYSLLTPVKNEIKTLYRIGPSSKTDDPPDLPATIYGSYTDDPSINMYYRKLASELGKVDNSEFSVLPIRFPTSDIELYGKQSFQTHPEQSMVDSLDADMDLVHAFSTRNYAVSGEMVEGVRYNMLPWWVDYSKLNLLIK